MSYPYPTIRKGPYSVYSVYSPRGVSGYGAYAAYGSTSSQPCIRKGAKGEAVKLLQAALAERGYNKDGSRNSEKWIEDEFLEQSVPERAKGNLCDPRCDGDFGSQTDKAVRAFQKDEFGSDGDDGIVGPNTWKKLGYTGSACSSGSRSSSSSGSSSSGSGGSGSAPRTYTTPSGEVLPTGFDDPWYQQKWFYWTAGVGGAAILAFLLWPKGKK